MNDYTMTYLAAERGRDLQAQADRERLARASRPHRASGPGQSRQVRQLGLGRLLRRVAV
jgi:hypothetical protein